MDREMLILKKDWRETTFRVLITSKEGSVEVPLEEFLRRVTALAKAPRNLAWTVRAASLQASVDKIIGDALSTAIKEIKTGTIKAAL